jgi:tRNA dimethylallyltransferase
MPSPTLIIIAGPTAVGKTAAAVSLAEKLRTEIISADSRQFYRELKIGSAMPDAEELARVKHHFIGNLSIHDDYNVSRYEQDALTLLNTLFETHDYVVMAGGSGLYIDAVRKGIDLLPDPDPELRKSLQDQQREEGLGPLLAQLKLLDPLYYRQVDQRNPVRVIRALEVCLTTGRPYSAMRNGSSNPRPFRCITICLELPRDMLMQRIIRRTKQMMADGLEEEARALLPWRDLNSLNTVGYKEMFLYFDGTFGRDEAIEKIITNTWRYAKRQLTWFRRDREIERMKAGDGVESRLWEFINKA